ncbi:MAG: MFS transporter [Coxiellaceae bacterium]|nr:MAG: MFS transporter [Coxiellaceae bacterium]
MILPVFAVYAQTLTGTSPGLLGLALGIYGLTQGLFQLPFGAISDRLGRKQVIAAGLVVFIIGSIIAALSSSIEGVILGRALQGIGAVGSTIMALVADLTRVEHRTRAMAILGVSIGFTFTLAMILGPLLNAWISVPGIFGSRR